MNSWEINAKQSDVFAPQPDMKTFGRLIWTVPLGAVLGLTGGNFAYQYLRPWIDQTAPDWRQAFERSWFQWMAALWICFLLHLTLRRFFPPSNKP